MSKVAAKKFKLKNGDTLLIRTVKKTDAKELIHYVNQVAGESDFLTFGKGEFKKTIREEEKIIQEHVKAENMIFLVAEIDKKIVGILNANGKNKFRVRHIAEFGITVQKKYWRMGIGSILIQSMLDWAKSSKVIRKLNLVVMSHNKPAIALYKKIGFKEEGRLRRDNYINGKFYDSYIMGILIN